MIHLGSNSCITLLSLFVRYYAAVLTLISFSLALQIVAGVLIIIIGEPIALQHLVGLK